MAYSDLSFILFLPIVFVGAFFLLNLTLAVINTSFTKENQRMQALENKAKEIARKNRVKKPNSDDMDMDDGEPA